MHIKELPVQIRQYRSFRKYRKLHSVLCKCSGHGFRYHILGIGR